MTHPLIMQSVTWVYTKDLDGTCKFYSEALGLVQVLDQGGCRVFRMAPKSFLGVSFARPGRFVEPKGVVITFVTDDVDRWYAHLVGSHVVTEGPPTLSEGGSAYAFFVRDPNGYLLEFQRFMTPDWPA